MMRDVIRAASQEILRCSFCQKPQDAVGKLISSPEGRARAYICEECVGVCETLEGHVHRDEVTSSAAEPTGSLRGLFAWYRRKHPARPCCSFCGKAKEAARELTQELIGSPDRRAYICYDCLGICRTILAEGATLSGAEGAGAGRGGRSL